MALRNTNDDGLQSNDALDDAVNDDPLAWKTWEEASLQCCLKQRTLTVTLQQVYIRYETKFLDWDVPSREDVQIFSYDASNGKSGGTSNASDIGVIVESIIKRQAEEAAIGTNEDGSSSPSVASKLLWYTVSTVGWSVSSMFAAGSRLIIGGGDDVENWRQAGDNALNHNRTPFSDRQAPIVQQELLYRCFRRLRHHLAAESRDFPLLLARRECQDQSHALSILPTWRKWCKLQESAMHTIDDPIASELLSNLNVNDSELLLQVLISMGMAQIVQRKKGEMNPAIGDTEIIALLGATEHGAQSCVPISIDTRMALLDLEIAHQATERQIEEWNCQIEKYEQKALAYKSKISKSPNDPNRKRALAELSKRKLLQQHVDDFSNRLLNLEQLKFALTSSQATASVAKALSNATGTLRTMRQAGPTVEEVDELFHESLLDELNSLGETQAAMNSNNMVVDDDELLAELEQLTINDKEDAANHNTHTAAGSPPAGDIATGSPPAGDTASGESVATSSESTGAAVPVAI